MITFFWETEEQDNVQPEGVLPALEQIVADYQLEVDYINIIFMDDEQLLEINREYLNHDYYTDIITFNYADVKGKVEAELYISVDRVKENAEEGKVPFKAELFRVMIHGVLHLAGFDDSSDTLREAMQQFEDKYLNVVCSTWNI